MAIIMHDCLGRTILNPVLATITLVIWMWISISALCYMVQELKSIKHYETVKFLLSLLYTIIIGAFVLFSIIGFILQNFGRYYPCGSCS